MLAAIHSDESDKVLVAKSLTELDALLGQCEEALRVSADEANRLFASFRMKPPLSGLPADPFSPEYRERQMSLFRLLTGREDYKASRDEITPFDLNSHVQRPLPWASGSCELVGTQLMMQGHLIRGLDLKPGARVLEFGPGAGNVVLHFALLGCSVTAVDVYQPNLDLIAARAARLNLAVELHCADMLEFQCDQGFDAIVFFECFHHCSDHMRMLRRLHGLLKPGGMVVFAGEPITREENDEVPYPWGFRMDGLTLWTIRRNGWFELGFTEPYFREALRRTGWTAEFNWSRDVAHCVTVLAKPGDPYRPAAAG